jgi:hypothetical protein
MRGINFTEPLFHKVVNGQKTQTRRIIPCPAKAHEGIQAVKKDGKIIRVRALDENGRATKPGSDDLEWILTPRYNVGETLYLKEPYCQDCDFIQHESSCEYWNNGKILYKYNGDEFPECAKYNPQLGKWQNKLFMPEEYARYYIKITGVRAERLQDISDEDCRKEGITYDMAHEGWCPSYNDPDSGGEPHYKEAYAYLFDSINGKGTWESDPFVWVYDFQLTKK